MSITLDDRDLTYDGSWFLGGAALYEYDNTTTATVTAGSTALINFTGISISVFGTIGPSNIGTGAPVSSYQIDNQPAVIFTAPVQGDTLYHYNFFTSSTLGNGPHQLIITNLNQSSYLWLDYVQYTPLSATSSSSSSSSSSTNSQQPITITTSSPSTSSGAPKSQTDPSSSYSSWTLAAASSLLSPNTQQQTTTSSSTAPGTQTDPSSSSSSSPVPQTSVQTTDKNYVSVIGGVVGGVVLVVVAQALIYYLRRRRDTRALVEERNTDVDNAHRNPAEASVSEVRSNDNFSLMSSAPLVRTSDWPRSKRSQYSSVVSPSVVGIRSMSYAEDLEADTFLPRQIVSEEQVYLHEDGGVRVAGGRLREQAEDIPPEYREYD
ncbi:hypothetical protein DEU56DRAFT_551478 [Suillus clintonianus]|uniref:uncharacterized protein n=1 Tax=Suillus clintonianus TaxID=1904413 RepID=UPI001B86EB98|nr:uncharacterized protein DEU56DRAFT_551478 [Suillus clintonianus]KAG2151434.1 hypothetical protein DEU56DRAFT_551478 [Suillus clintonianus]